MSAITKFLRLSRGERALLLRAVWWLAIIRLALGILGYRRLTAVLEERLNRPRVDQPPSKLIWAVRAAARAHLGSRCLSQGLCLHYLLARAGHDSCLRIGVSGGARDFGAHAWVVFKDKVVIGERALGERQFTSLADLHLRASWAR
jgi:hypothetical protein